MKTFSFESFPGRTHVRKSTWRLCFPRKLRFLATRLSTDCEIDNQICCSHLLVLSFDISPKSCEECRNSKDIINKRGIHSETQTTL